MEEVLKSNHKKGKVSVIIPCYNQGKFLDDAVSSVLNQTYQDFEIIIINDGSTDKYTIDLLKDFKRPKTKVYHTKNQGLASTRNYGFSLAKGEFVQFLDADDFLNPKKFEDQISSFSKDSKLGVSYTNCQYYYDEKKEYSESLIKKSLTANSFEDFVYKWQRGVSIPIHCALFKKTVWDKKRPFVQGFGAIEDWLMWVDLAKDNVKFSFLDKNYAYYRIQNNNMTKNLPFMFYWVSRAISYIAENYIEEKDLMRFNSEQEKYLRLLIDLYFTAKLEEKYKTELVKQKKEIELKDNKINIMKSELVKQKKEIELKDNKINIMKSELVKQKKEIELKDNKINIMKSDLKNTKVKIDEIKKSKSYKIGLFVAWLPRKIVKIFKSK